MDPSVSPAEIKAFIIQCLELEDLRPEDIGDDENLFQGGLGLDSVDALELGMALSRRYGLLMEEAGPFKDRLSTPRALAEFISSGA